MSESDFSSQESTPPSFLPSGTPRQRGRNTSAHAADVSAGNGVRRGSNATHAPEEIPSFAPAQSRASRSSGSRAQQPRQSQQSQPASFVPSAQHPRAHSQAQHDAAAYEQPASFAPQQQRMRSGSTSVHMSAPTPRPQMPVKPKRSKAKIAGISLLTVLCALIAVCLIAGFLSISWVNKHLQHESWLTNMTPSSASTWLILGSDQRDGTANTGSATDIPGSRTDTILLLTKPKSGPASLISIPRDSYVSPQGQDMKINAVASTLGRSELVSTIEGIIGYKVDHVVKVGFSGVEQVVDALGGVTLCYDSDVNDSYSGLNWQAGCHDADGATALAFSRMRYADPKGDIGRAERQRQVISAMVKKASSSKVLSSPSKVKKLAEAGLGAVVVDEKADAFSLISLALAFRQATGSDGITGTPYYSDPDYYPESGIGSTVLLDAKRNATLFEQLEKGSISAGTVVGGMSS